MLLLIEAGVLGSFLALDMVLFFMFFEVALIPMWFVVNGWGDPARPGRHGCVPPPASWCSRCLGSAVMLVGFPGGAQPPDRHVRHRRDRRHDTRRWARRRWLGSLLIGLGVAVKTPVAVALLAARRAQQGPDRRARCCWPPSPEARHLRLHPVLDAGDQPSWRLLVPFVAGLAVVGIVYAALACLAQTELKRLIAYSSVGHMGFVVLAVATFTVGGVQGAVYASVAHGLITGLLFFVAGAIKDRYGTGELDRLNVLYGRVPRLAAVFAFGAMASLGLPGLAGFWGEMLAIRSAVYHDRALPEATFVVLAVIAAFGVILTSAYFLAVMRGMLQGAPEAVRPVNAGVPSIELASDRGRPGGPAAWARCAPTYARSSGWRGHR